MSNNDESGKIIVDYDVLAGEMWDDSVKHVDDCKVRWNAEHGEKKLTAHASAYNMMRQVWCTGSYTAAGLLLFATTYLDETDDKEGYDMIVAFAKVFNRREAEHI